MSSADWSGLHLWTENFIHQSVMMNAYQIILLLVVENFVISLPCALGERHFGQNNIGMKCLNEPIYDNPFQRSVENHQNVESQSSLCRLSYKVMFFMHPTRESTNLMNQQVNVDKIPVYHVPLVGTVTNILLSMVASHHTLYWGTYTNMDATVEYLGCPIGNFCNTPSKKKVTTTILV